MNSIVSARVRTLCDIHQISFSKLERDLGLSAGAISKWRTVSSPSIDKVLSIARYFNVSVDYLLGATEVMTPVNSFLEDKDIVAIQRAREKMSDLDKNRMMQMVRIGFQDAFNETDDENT